MERIRFTIAVEPEVHAAFAELAEAGGQSLSRAIGDWLKSTAASSLFVATKMRELKLSPERAMTELLAFQEGPAKQSLATDTAETRRLLASIAAGQRRGGTAQAAAERPAERSRRADPPPSNTGGKGRSTAKRGTPR